MSRTRKETNKDEQEFERLLEEYEHDEGEKKGEAQMPAIKPTAVSGTSATFKDFMLRPELMKALQENTFEAPSVIQQEAIPAGIIGTDLLCQAQSGSGKTCVFVLTVLQQLKVKPGVVQCICIAPTRELAYQIKGEFSRFSKHIPNVSIACFTGGFPEAKDRRMLQVDPPTIVVGTPGRLEALLTRPSGRRTMPGEPDTCLDASHVEFFIIDECDQILKDEKLCRDVKLIHAAVWGGFPSASTFEHRRNGRIIKPVVDSAKVVASGMLTAGRRIQTMMFSATMDQASLKIANDFFPRTNDPLSANDETADSPQPVTMYTGRKEIFIDNPQMQLLSGILQRVVMVLERNKNAVLGGLLDALQFTQLVIFVSTHERAERLEYLLTKNGYQAICTHANLPQEQRESRCADFKNMKYRILVATDLLHRGIDITAVNAVINYDMPENSDIYLHRIGRAGRFSTYGLAISFCVPDTEEDKERRKAREEQAASAAAAESGATAITPGASEIVDGANEQASATPQHPAGAAGLTYVQRTNEEILEDIQNHFAKKIPELVIDGALDPNLQTTITVSEETLEGIKSWRKEKTTEGQ